MHAPVVDHAAAVFRLRAPAEHRAARAVQRGAHGVHIAQFARFQHGLDSAEILVPAAVLVHGEDAAVGLGGRDHLVQLGERHGRGLFADHMLARRQRRAHQLAVRIVRRGHQHEVDLLIAQKIVQPVVSAQARFPRGGHARGVDVIRGYNLHALHAGRVVQVPFSHVPKPDNTQLNAHFCFLPPGREIPRQSALV